jgi:hypothetical protein
MAGASTVVLLGLKNRKKYYCGSTADSSAIVLVLVLASTGTGTSDG